MSLKHIIGMMPKGVPAFTPASVTGLRQWFKADAITGLSDGAAIATWPDSSGSGLDATQASGALQPLYKAGIVNSKPVARFDGVNDCFTIGNHSALTAGEVFVAIKLVADPPASGGETGLWIMGGAGASDTRFPFTNGVIFEQFGTDTRKTTVDPTLSLSSTFRVYNVWSAANDWASNLDGGSLFTTATNTVAFNSACLLGVTGSGFYLHGDIAEFILYNNKISTGNRASVLSYLQSKYGL